MPVESINPIRILGRLTDLKIEFVDFTDILEQNVLYDWEVELHHYGELR